MRFLGLPGDVILLRRILHVNAIHVDQVILDGEVDWGDRNVEYHVFDILWLNRRDLMPLPLMERRAILHDLELRCPRSF